MQENIQVLASLWKPSFEQQDATKPRRITSSEGHYSPFLSNIKGQASHPDIQQDVNCLKVNFAWKLEEELFSSVGP